MVLEELCGKVATPKTIQPKPDTSDMFLLGSVPRLGSFARVTG